MNFKAIGILVGALALIFPPMFLFRSWSTERIRASAIAQSNESLERNDGELALRHLDRFLADHPDDLITLQAKADLLSKIATSADMLLKATQIHDQLIRIDPEGKDRLATRRRLIELYITYGELIRIYADGQNDGQIQARESRFLAAITAAKELIDYKDQQTGKVNGDTDAAAHRLLAMAYMGQVPGLIVKKTEDSIALGEAKKELDRALQIDPSDTIASEKLAELFTIHLKDPKRAELTLDHMLDSLKTKKFASDVEERDANVKIRLSRFRAFYLSGESKKAQAELSAALEFAPTNVDLLISAAGLALQRGDHDECRQRLDQISQTDQKDNLKVRFLRGSLEFAERHPDEAIEQWKKGLSLVGGGSVDLTWRLAANLIQFNRLIEARPLVDQYLRLARPNDPLGIYLEGMYNEKSGHINKAIELMTKASEQVPLSFKADVFMSLGHCYELIGDESRALYVYKKAAALGTNSSGSRRAIARLYIASNPERAISELETAWLSSTRDDPTKGDPNILIDLIRIKIDAQLKLSKVDRDFRQVAALLDQAKKLAPENPTVRGLLAQYQSVTSGMDEAVKTLEATVNGSNRKRMESWLAWAEALERLGRNEDALVVVDKGSAPDAAGDHASLRIIKARLLLKLGEGTRAKEALTANLDTIPKPEQPDLSKALGDLLQELGDRAGARASYEQWARLAPESPFPALKLLSIAQLDGDEEASRAGLDLLAKLDRSNEPYGLAARALQFLRTDPAKPGPPSPDRLAEAEKLVVELNKIAPDFPVKYMIQGMISESRADPKDPKQWRESLTKAGESYRKSIKIGTASPALPKLIEIYMKLKDDDKLNLLKIEYDEGAKRQRTEISMEFDRLSTLIALKLGDRERAAAYLDKMSEGRPDNREVRFAQARMNESSGKLDKAEAALLDLVKSKPQEEITWIELIRFQARRRTPTEVARTINQARQAYSGDRPELFLANCYFSGNDKPNAIREYQNALAARPDDLVTLKAVVEFREATNQGDQVEPILRKVLQLDPGASWAARDLALRLSARGNPAEWAEAWLLIAPGSTYAGNRPDDRLIRATILARSSESSRRAEAVPAFASLANDLPLSNNVGIEARIRLSQAMLDFDRSADAWSYIAPLADDMTKSYPIPLVIAVEALSRMGKGVEAEKRLSRLNSLVPNSPQIAISRGWVLHAQGKNEESAASIVSAFDSVEKERDGESVGLTCLELLIRFDDRDAALALARRIATRWPRDSGSLARVQIALKDYDGALISCQAALDNGSPREAIRYASAAAVARRGNKEFIDKAVAIGDKAQSKASNDPGVMIFLATLRHVQDRYEQELAFYRMALEFNPSNRQFLNNMAWTLSEGLEKPEEALQKIEEIIKVEGPAYQYLDTRGVIYTRLKQYDKAIADLELAVKGDSSAATYFHLARAYLKAGKLDDYRRCRDIAITKKFDPSSLDPTDKANLEEVMGKP